MNNWQPIETAPKDGSRILIGNSNNVQEVRWHADYGDWGDPVYSEWYGLKAGKPTHWQSLPNPPEK